MRDGQEIPETRNMKSDKGFGAMLWLASDIHIAKPEDGSSDGVVTGTQRTKRNVPIYVIVLIMNPGVNEQNYTDVVFDLQIKNSDDEVVLESKDIFAENMEVPSYNDRLRPAESRVGIELDEEEALGMYTVVTVVRDRARNAQVHLEADFRLE